MSVAEVLKKAEESMTKSIDHLQNELGKIRTGKANPSLLNTVIVEAYGTKMPLNQVASISTPDARTISIQAFDKGLLPDIEKAILQANIGLNPQNDGEFIRLNIPPLTEERRKELVKQARSEGENAKISLRNARKEAIDQIKSLGKDSLSEDQVSNAEDDVQKLVNKHNSKVDAILEAKESDIMTV